MISLFVVMSDRGDPVWEHGENIYPGFKCKYCRSTKKGGGATRLKQHLAGRGSSVVACLNVPPDVRDFFSRELDKSEEKRKARITEASKKLAAAAGSPNDSEHDEEMQAVLRASREEEGGGSSQAAGGLRGLLRRVASQKEKPEMVQTRIDTGPFSKKGKGAKAFLGKQWSKWFHAEAIPGSKADSPYFINALRETQRHGMP